MRSVPTDPPTRCRTAPLPAVAACAWVTAAALAWSGCALPRPVKEVVPPPPAASAFHQRPAEGTGSAAASGPWWHCFADATLDGLVSEALAESYELERLRARAEQARALLREARGRLRPTLDVGAGGEASRSRDWDAGEDERNRSASLDLLLGWELDPWGRLRSARRAGDFDARAAAEDWRAGRLFLSAAVAETYFQVLEERLQLDLLAEQIAVNETLLDLTRLRFGQGQSSIVDVLQQQEQLAATRALVPAIAARAEELELVLDILVGRAPGERPRLTAEPLGAPPPPPELGRPADLIVARPDVRAAESRVIALDHRVAEAMAERLPDLAVGGTLGLDGDFAPHTWIARVFASITGPLFDAGVREAEVDRRQARLEEAMADFALLYLDAVREVETALVAERERAARLRLLEAQLDTAQRLLAETRNRYRQGLTDYLPVLSAVVTEQNLQRTVLTSRRELLSARVALHRALGSPVDAPSPIASEGP